MATKISSDFQAQWPPALDPAAKPALVKLAALIQKIARIIFYPLVALYNHIRNIACRVIMPGCIKIPEPPDSWWEIAKVIARFIWNPDSYKADLTDYGNTLLDVAGGKRVVMKTPDGVAIEGAFFRNTATDRVVIVSGGNGTQWEVQERWLTLLKPLGVSVMLLNPRGAGNSHGMRSPDGWALDFYTAAEHLFKREGFAPENCLPMGFSMGAATATRGAALIQNRYPSVDLPALNLCSFSSLKDQVSAMFGPKVAFFAKVGLAALNLSMNPAAAMQKLKGQRVVMYRPDDEIIPYSGSMASSITKSSDIKVVSLDSHTYHNDALSDKERAAIQYEVRRLLNLPQPLFSRAPQAVGIDD